MFVKKRIPMEIVAVVGSALLMIVAAGPTLGQSNREEKGKPDRERPTATESNENRSKPAVRQSDQDPKGPAERSGPERNRGIERGPSDRDAFREPGEAARAGRDEAPSSRTGERILERRPQTRENITPPNEARRPAKEEAQTRAESRRQSEAARKQFKVDRDFGVSVATGDRERLRVARVAPNSIASRAGLREGDVLVSVHGRRVRSWNDFGRFLFLDGLVRVPIVYLRDGVEYTDYVDTTDFGPRNEYYVGGPWLGVDLDPRYDNQAVVLAVYRGSSADQAGIQVGDQIVRFNGHEIQSPDQLIQFVQEMQPGERVPIELAYRGRTEIVNATLDERPQ